MLDRVDLTLGPSARPLGRGPRQPAIRVRALRARLPWRVPQRDPRGASPHGPRGGGAGEGDRARSTDSSLRRSGPSSRCGTGPGARPSETPAPSEPAYGLPFALEAERMVRSALRAAAAAGALPTPPDIQGLGIEGAAPDGALMRAVSRGLATYSRLAGPGLRPDRQTAPPNSSDRPRPAARSRSSSSPAARRSVVRGRRARSSTDLRCTGGVGARRAGPAGAPALDRGRSRRPAVAPDGLCARTDCRGRRGRTRRAGAARAGGP